MQKIENSDSLNNVPITVISEEVRDTALNTAFQEVNILTDDVKPKSYNHLFEMLDAGFKDHGLNATLFQMGRYSNTTSFIKINIEDGPNFYIAEKIEELARLKSDQFLEKDNCFLWSDISSMKKFLEFFQKNGLRQIERKTF